MRKPVLEKVHISNNYSFSIENISLPYFISKWHYHPEMEIILITDAYGTGFIGNGLTSFRPGTLAIIGAYTPHVWLCYEEYYKGNAELTAEAIAIKFSENFLGAPFLQIPGVSRIRSLFHRSRQGLIFGGNLDAVKNDIIQLKSYDDLEKIISLLNILNKLSKSEDARMISTITSGIENNGKNYDRLDAVIKHVSSHFKRNIPVHEVAELIHLTPASFCRFFKSRTLKSFTRFVNEVRIEYACKLLLENKLNANEICYEVGFKHLSNFYKQFQNIKNMTPIEFRKEYWKRHSVYYPESENLN